MSITCPFIMFRCMALHDWMTCCWDMLHDIVFQHIIPLTASSANSSQHRQVLSSRVTLLRSLLFLLSTYTVQFISNILYLYICRQAFGNFLSTTWRPTEFDHKNLPDISFQHRSELPCSCRAGYRVEVRVEHRCVSVQESRISSHFLLESVHMFPCVTRWPPSVCVDERGWIISVKTKVINQSAMVEGILKCYIRKRLLDSYETLSSSKSCLSFEGQMLPTSRGEDCVGFMFWKKLL